MSRREDYERRTEALLKPILDRLDFVLWDVEYVKEGADYYLRAYIDKEGGITIDDCVEVSRTLSDELDRENFIDDAYILEVSSPGLGRTLKKDKDFERSIGQSVDIKTYKAVEGHKEYSGTLISCNKDILELETGEGRIMIFNRSDIAKANLSIDF
ncbi:MAG: ribosome maturation factor RimP [Lachnospiraceae bacterium]|nr:ribosome maturation factor RimP [Lachnospiraceae bacterium]